jgi:hypothetical protein
MIINKILILILVIILSLLAYFLIFKNLTPTDSINIDIKNQTYQFEIAKTMSQKSLGLGNRDNLCQNCGMIFVYQNEGILPFWMKNTHIPLDIIWLDKNGKIVDIKTAQPEPNTPDLKLTIYQNPIPAQYVLEINAKETEKLKLGIGDTIKLPSQI